MNNMKLYKVTSNNKARVIFVFRRLKKEFKQKGHEISDIIIIIHGHDRLAYFSSQDIITYKKFKGEGFEGKFLLYVWRNKTIYELAEKLR
jgi:hypothetical protein